MMNFDSGQNKFLENDCFVDWANNPNSIYKEYWEQYFIQNPNEQKNADEAIAFIKQLRWAEQSTVRQVKESEKEKIWQHINASLSLQTPAVEKKKSWKLYYSIAASLIILIGSAGLYRLISTTPPQFQQSEAISANNSSEILDSNNTNLNKIVYLSDGSVINLSPGSVVRHQRLFTGSKREVYLKGEAFFEVSKNKEKPFYVYTGDLVTRVVGTSFNISYPQKDGNITVAVRTGKVMVYKQGSEQQQEGIKMLYPMQQCTYRSGINALNVDGVVNKKLLESKHIPEKETSLNFEDTDMETVFNMIEKRFGVVLIRNKNDFKSTDNITVMIENESLENILNIICKTAGATCRIDNDFIFIDKKP